MEEVFIRRIKINEARNLRDFDIPLSNHQKKHLIVTGKNGSGKTSLLKELAVFLDAALSSKGTQLESYHREADRLLIYKNQLDLPLDQYELVRATNDFRHTASWLKQFGGTYIDFNEPALAARYYKEGGFIMAYFGAQRNILLKTPTGINKIDLKSLYDIDEQANEEFIQYIVNLKADRSFAKDDNDLEAVKKIDEWFEYFESSLFRLFDNDKLTLEFDRKSYNFYIIEQGKTPYNLNQLSGGYSAILSIITELIMRMEAHKTKSYDLQGVVLIDEIETHLHVELQKRVLPFLISFFPKIQFIVTTHSPFVINSVENAVICDLEKRIVTEDLSGYSYDTIIESYFNADKYSDVLKEKLEDYERLMHKEHKNKSETEKLIEYKQYFKSIPKFISDELAVKLQQIRLEEMSKRGN
jgi:predicted ATP-binding protein involved in virulence